MGVFVYTFLALATLLSSAKSESVAVGVSQPIIVSGQVSAVVGEPVTISCLSGSNNPLQLCRWERKPRPPNGKRYFITMKEGSATSFGSTTTDENDHDIYNCNCSYKYSGKGLDKGDCSMSIHNVTDFHFAKWECTLQGKEGRAWVGSLNISKPLSEPYSKNAKLLNETVYNETSPTNTDVTCCAEAYDPLLSININILLENSQDAAPTDLQRQSGSGNIMQRESGLSFRGEEACRRSRYLFKPKDNGKRVICVARFMYNSHEYNQTTFHPVNVKYKPILTSESFAQNMTANNSLLITATFMANPAPDSRWFLESHPASGASFEIRKDHPKYKTDVQCIQGDHYVATLEILNLEPEDYRGVFLLKIESAFGEEDVHVHLRDPNAPIEEPASDWVMIIIAVSIIVSLVLIAAVIFICIKQRVNRGKYIPTKVSYSKEDDVN